jgi:hypothetical protein
MCWGFGKRIPEKPFESLEGLPLWVVLLFFARVGEFQMPGSGGSLLRGDRKLSWQGAASPGKVKGFAKKWQFPIEKMGIVEYTKEEFFVGAPAEGRRNSLSNGNFPGGCGRGSRDRREPPAKDVTVPRD